MNWRGIRGQPSAITLGLENRTRERLRIPSKGLVASLQTVYEPLIEGEPLEGRMLARPLQGAGTLHGLESASSPPPLSNTTQLGAGKESSIESFSSSQSRSVSGRSPSRFTDLPGVRLPNSANSASVIEHVIAPNHNQPLPTTPTRRLSEPNRTRTIMVEETRMKSSIASSQVDMVGNRPKITTKGLNALKAMTGNRDNEDEELQYGPGIVNKLKSRYLSRTLRERPLGESRRPSLRRAASLEDWLDKDSSPPHPSSNDNNFAVLVRSSNGRAKSERPSSLNLVAQTTEPKLPPRPLSSSPVKIRDLKKTRSVDCVSQQPAWRSVSVSDLVVVPSAQQPKPSKAHAAVPPSPTVSSPKTPVHLLLGKDAIVIVDKDDNQVAATDESKGNVAAVTAHTAPTAPTAPTASTASTASSPGASKTRRTLPANSRYNVEDAELPAPDTVRQVKRIFESGSGRKVSSTRRSQSAGPGINRTPLSAANQTTEKSNIHRMNQVNLVNNKSISSVARKKSESTPRITELVSPDTKPVVITKPSPIGPKPSVLSPKPAVVIDKTRVVQSSSNGAPSLQRTTAPPAKLAAQPAPSAAFVSSVTAPASKESCDQLDNKDELENHAGGHGFKIISKTALDNIREESNSVKFNFDEKKDDKSPFSLGSVQSRQVGVIRPQPKSPVIQNEKPVVLEELTPKDDVDSVSKKEDLLVTAASNSLLIGLAKTQPKTELAQPQTTSKPASPPVFAPKFQAASRTKQITAPATVSKSEPVILTQVISPSSSTAPVPTSVSVTPPAEKKATDNPTVVTVPVVKTLSSSSQTAKPPNSTPVNTTATVGAHSISTGTTREQPTKKWHPHQSETTTVFNFVNDTSRKTDHIRNEGGSSGILVYKSNDSGITKLPDYDPGESSDFIDDLDVLKRPPSPCNVDFEGANIIVGKSLIQRRTKKCKMTISFNDDMTKLFEYPSETSLLEESDDVKSISKKSDQDFRDTSSQISTSNSKGGLSSYTPSKVHFETTFELGISRSTLPDSSLEPNPPSSPIQMDSVLHYIKPAEESTTWSAETTADLLF